MRSLRLSKLAALGLTRTAAATLSRLTEREPEETLLPAPAASPFPGEDLVLPRMIYPGARVEERYWIEEEIGIGGLCFVHRVRDEQTGQVFALKTLQPNFAAMPFYFDMMRREADIQSTVRHPNILACERLISTEDGRRALLLPHLSGGTLSQRIGREGPLSPEACRALLAAMLDVLGCLRQSGISHLDIAPDNIMYCDGDCAELRLIDFGLSRNDGGATLPGEEDLFLGKMSWASPEMIAGGTITPDSDLYSLGLVLHFAMTGERFPREDDTPPPTDAGVPEDIARALGVLLDLDPQRRRTIYRDRVSSFEAARLIA